MADGKFVAIETDGGFCTKVEIGGVDVTHHVRSVVVTHRAGELPVADVTVVCPAYLARVQSFRMLIDDIGLASPAVRLALDALEAALAEAGRA